MEMGAAGGGGGGGGGGVGGLQIALTHVHQKLLEGVSCLVIETLTISGQDIRLLTSYSDLIHSFFYLP
jgi:hypothetical protein